MILEDVSANNHDLQAQINALRAENARLKVQNNSKHKMKVAEASSGLSIYGFGRWPVTLYKAQRLTLLDMAEQIRAFIDAHNDELSDTSG